MTNTPITPEEAVKLLREAVARARAFNYWGVTSYAQMYYPGYESKPHTEDAFRGAERHMLDGIFSEALDATAHLVEPAQTGGSDE